MNIHRKGESPLEERRRAALRRLLLTVVIMTGFIIAGVLCMVKVDVVILKIVILVSIVSFFPVMCVNIDTLDDFFM